jgi:hypothetical protein
MTNTAQKFIDNLVITHPNASGGEILQMIAPERRDAARALLRWPPGVPRPKRQPVRPTGRVNVGNPSSDGERD